MKTKIFLILTASTIATTCNASDGWLDTTDLVLNESTFSFDIETNVLSISKNGATYLTDTIDKGFDFHAIQKEYLNQDNIPDVAIKMSDADASLEIWFTYNAITNSFEKVTGLEWIVEPKRLELEGNFFYTRSPNGCTGKIWTSELFWCYGSKITLLGTIDFDGCTEGAETEDGINISFVKSENGTKFVIKEEKSVIMKIYNGTLTLEDYWLANFKKYN
jgi:hypothetical protein